MGPTASDLVTLTVRLGAPYHRVSVSLRELTERAAEMGHLNTERREGIKQLLTPENQGLCFGFHPATVKFRV